MILVGQPERARQNRVTGLFRDALGSRETGPWVEFGFPQALPTSGVTGEVAGEVTGEVTGEVRTHFS